MPLRTNSEIIRALAQYRAEDVLGTAETTTLDFKRCLYQLRSDKGKFDLCLDVAAMANASGGLIVCGFKADKSPTEVHECATQVAQVPLSQLDVPRHQHVLLQYVWPRVQVDLDFYPYAQQEQGEGFLVIDIKPLPEHERYAMVRRFLSDDGKLVEGFAIPVRHGDQTTYLSAEELHRLLTDGRRFHDLAIAGSLRPTGPAQPSAAEQFDARLDAVLRTKPTWSELGSPVLAWQSAPERPVEILEGLHERDGGVYGALYTPESLRQSGFNFGILGDAPRIDAGSILISDQRRALRVDPDGAVTAAALATNEMLGWASTPIGSVQRLNVFALTEMTLEYYRLVDQHIAPRAPGTWRHRIRALRFQDPTAIVLGPGGNPRYPIIGDALKASAPDWDQSWTALVDPERDAYEALSRLYMLFGLPISKNPFVEDKRVSTQKLLASLDP